LISGIPIFYLKGSTIPEVIRKANRAFDRFDHLRSAGMVRCLQWIPAVHPPTNQEGHHLERIVVDFHGEFSWGTNKK